MRDFDPSQQIAMNLGRHRTAVASSGASDGAVVCCLHSLGVDHRAFAGLARVLDQRWRLVAFDQRGHGQATAASDSISLDAMARDVWSVLDALGVASVHLVGHSMGGTVAAIAASLAPSRCATLTLIATPADGGDAFRQRALAGERDGMAAMVEPTLARWFDGDSAASDELRAYARRCVSAMPVEHWAAAWRALASFDGYADLGQRLPATLCISAERDASTPPATLEQIAGQVPRAVAHRTVPRSGHMVPMTQPDAIARLVDEFFLSSRSEH